ncbi:MAG: hypothetical protein IT487_05915, partial [Chromatiaceae bacterium]|nr:hypothetical protein [Chromatiaceae bacterium]
MPINALIKSPVPANQAATPGTALKGAPFEGYVVCIGASAGGLDALEKFFKACPMDL